MVVLPAYNEEKNIARVIERIFAAITQYELEVVVVDDGSQDATIDVAQKAGAHTILRHEINKGVGAAFQTAVEYFFSSGADVFVNIDSDGQFPPEEIEMLAEPVLSGGYDISIASRFGGKDARNMPRIKYVLNKWIAGLISLLMHHPIDDLTCGFRVYSRESLLKLSLHSSFTYTQEVIIDAISQGLRIIRKPVTVTYYPGRKSRVVKSIITYMAKSIMIITRTVRDARPLLFFGVPALVCIVIGVFLLLGFLIQYLLTLQTTPYRTRLIGGGIFLLLGLVLFIFASIADMIKRHKQTTEKNLYYLRKIHYKLPQEEAQ